MNILVTGATGFIGSHLTESLIKEKHRVFALVRQTSKVDFLLKNSVELIYGDITDTKSLTRIADYSIDAVFHCAACVTDNDWKRIFRTNVLGTENICKLCTSLKVRRLVYLSSVAVVSGNPCVPLTEDSPYLATNLYGASKIDAEKRVIEFRESGLPVAIVRPPVVYGEGEPHAFNQVLFLLKHGLLPLFEGGVVRWHLAYVKNVVDALLLALERQEFLRDTFFVADEEVLTVKEIFSTLSQAINAPNPQNLPSWLTALLSRAPYIGEKIRFLRKDRVYDINRIKSLGFNPRFHTQESLIKSARHWLEEKAK